MTCPEVTQLAPVPNRPRIPVFQVQTECASCPASLPTNPLFSLPPARKGPESLHKGQAGSRGRTGKQTAVVPRAFAIPGAHQVPSTFSAFDPHGNVMRQETALRSQAACQGLPKQSVEKPDSNPGSETARTQAPGPSGGPWPLGLTPVGVSLFSQHPFWPEKKFSFK